MNFTNLVKVFSLEFDMGYNSYKNYNKPPKYLQCIK